ncbi:MAG: hypothetical protein P8129_11995 [Anaerolineae bacterium]
MPWLRATRLRDVTLDGCQVGLNGVHLARRVPAVLLPFIPAETVPRTAQGQGPGAQHVELGLGIDQGLGQRVQPAQQRAHLAAGQQRPPDPVDQVCGAGQLACCQQVAHCLGMHSFLQVPRACSPVQLRHEIWTCPIEALAQQVGKEAMVAVPAALVVQGHEEEVCCVE